MGNITDYIAWRGDLPFEVSSFNQIDSLVLCQILYADLDTILSTSLKKRISLSQVAKEYYDRNLHKKNLGALINNETSQFLQSVGLTKRFSNVTVFGFTNVVDIEQEVQFAAMSALLPTGELCVIFRGTDDTLIGWKEDFNMSYTSPVPSQKLALEYLETVCSKIKTSTYVMGHSKGGNLSVYASSFCNAKVSRRILSVFDNDGPGFPLKICEQKSYIENAKRTHSVIPESSIVGILLNRLNTPIFIESSARSGIAQHDIFTWQLTGTKLTVATKQSATSVLASKAVDSWLLEVEIEKRKKFIDEFFHVLEATHATTLLELTDNWIHCSVAILKRMNELDKKTKDQIYNIVMMLFHAIQINLPPLKEFFSHDTKKIKSK